MLRDRDRETETERERVRETERHSTVMPGYPHQLLSVY